MISFEKPAGWKCLELGCGANRHPQADVATDVRYIHGHTDFAVDLNAPTWPEIGSEGFEIVLSIFTLEHISWRNTPNFLKEVFRILKPGGKAIFVTPNTEAQIRWVMENGWEKNPKSDGAFIESARILFGDLDYAENSHRSFLSPSIVAKLFSEAGFVNVLTTPFGAIQTDMVIEANKPHDADRQPTPPPNPQPVAQNTPTPQPAPLQEAPRQVIEPTKPAKEIYNYNYFNQYQGGGFYWDFPQNEIIYRKVMERQPSSVLELGCARGYVLKKLNDTGIQTQGLDVSQHAWMTRVCESINICDLQQAPWPVGKQEFDLALSISLLEHIPESKVPQFMEELTRVSHRGLHGVTLEGLAPNHDPTRCTLRPLDWWKRILPEGHEVVDIRELSNGQLPPEYIQGDGKTKLNLGCAWTMFYGWDNVDGIDAKNFAQTFNYRFRQHDLTKGVPNQTGTVDRIFAHHFLEHITQDEAMRFLKDCRRVIRPDGAMRLVVPNTVALISGYQTQLDQYDHINENCAKAKTNAAKLWAMLVEGHKMIYDWETLYVMLTDAGWSPTRATFREATSGPIKDILHGTTEMDYGGESLFVDALPIVG